MRLWTLHPRYLDARGLVALWREALLAQAVLRGRTRGYRHHPQLERFRAHDEPLGSIAAYLRVVHDEAASRGYAFARKKISRASCEGLIVTTRGQLEFEWQHLRAKLGGDDPVQIKVPDTHSHHHRRERLDRLHEPGEVVFPDVQPVAFVERVHEHDPLPGPLE